MRWAKIILLFQAIVTLILGIVFFSQLTIIGASDLSEITAKLSTTPPAQEDTPATLDNLRVRYTVASYTLLVIGLVEVILIVRLLS
ncbi:hypothetical protein J4226_01440 [Candidatus Pacearchaeota archaeon]|nr:hypothetical protein [Candidatus Pacearchaeota archaeon]